jgi:hypothetical protein
MAKLLNLLNQAGNAYYDYKVGRDKRDEINAHTNLLQEQTAKMKQARGEEENVNNILKNIRSEDTETTSNTSNVTDYGTDLAAAGDQPVKGGMAEEINYGTPRQEQVTTQTTKQVPRPIYDIQRDAGIALIKNGQAKMGQMYLANAQKEKEAHYDHLATRLFTIGKSNPEIANQMLKSPMYKGFNADYSIPEDANINFETQEFEKQMQLNEDYVDPITKAVYPKGSWVDISWKNGRDPFSPNAMITKFKKVSGGDEKVDKAHLIWTSLHDPDPDKRQKASEALKETQRLDVEVAGVKTNVTEKAKIDAQRGLISPEALEQAYQYVKTTGAMPPEIGRIFRLPGAQVELSNYVAKRQAEEGITGIDRAVSKAVYETSKSELNKLKTNRGMIMAFETTANKNADLVDQFSSKVDRLGVPALDRWFLAGKKQIAGDTNVAQLDLAVRTFINEYARVTTTVTGGGVTSDQARKDIEAAINSAQTKEQLKAVIALAKQEMQNRRFGYESEIANVTKALSEGAKPTPTPQTMSGKTTLSKDGNSVVKDGKPYPISNGKVTINGVTYNVKPKSVSP